MLKGLARKLVTLFVLIAALTAVSSTPASSTNSRWYCQEVPICSDGCCNGYWCCDNWGNCMCG
jgi:hypothetical protein